MLAILRMIPKVPATLRMIPKMPATLRMIPKMPATLRMIPKGLATLRMNPEMPSILRLIPEMLGTLRMIPEMPGTLCMILACDFSQNSLNELLFESAKKFRLPFAWLKINSYSDNLTIPFSTEGLYCSSGTCPGHFRGGADRKICRQNSKNMPTNYERFADRVF